MNRPDLFKRLEALEHRAAPQTGLGVFLCLLAADSLSDRMQPVIALEADNRKGERVRYERQPGESLFALHSRANPAGSWRARPRPILGEMRPLLDGEAWRLGG
jgi:hypothetical protein